MSGYLEGLASQVPADFRFGLKVTDEITIRRFPKLPRFGFRAGQPNEHSLDAVFLFGLSEALRLVGNLVPSHPALSIQKRITPSVQPNAMISATINNARRGGRMICMTVVLGVVDSADRF